MALAEEMLLFRDESAINFAFEERLSHSMMMLESGHGMASIPRTGRITCCVCQLEKQFCIASAKSGVSDGKIGLYPMRNIVGCTKKDVLCMPIRSKLPVIVIYFRYQLLRE